MPIDVSEQHRLLMPMSFHHMRLRRNEQADAGYGLQHRQQLGTYQPLMASTPMTPEGRQAVFDSPVRAPQSGQ